MGEHFPAISGSETIEGLLQSDLDQSDRMMSTAYPILQHLLQNADHAMFNDEIVARVRWQLLDLARQVVVALGEAAGHDDPQEWAHEVCEDLSKQFLVDPLLVGYCHALAVEWQLSHRLQTRNGVDPVLSPLVQAMVSGQDEQLSPLAMRFLAAQARFGQQQQRMELPIAELSADHLHQLLAITQDALTTGDAEGDHHIHAALASLRNGHDESASRLGLAARLIAGIGGGARAALCIEHAGPALFLTTLSAFCGLTRNVVTLSTSDCQMARLALALSAAGLKPDDMRKQFFFFHPDSTLPEGLEFLRADRAAALLAASEGSLGY